MLGAIYVKESKNSKLAGKDGKIDATYASIKKTCSKSCKLNNGGGCYAVKSYVGIVNARLTKEAESLTALQVARQEAKAIDESYLLGEVPENRFLRLHVSGDTKTIKGSKLINSASGRFKKKGGAGVYSYTHSWKNVPAKTWTNVSMLASVDSVKEANQARKLGYAPAIIVPEHTTDKAFTLKGSSIKWIPCPAQTKSETVTCLSCKLCMKADYLHSSKHGIAFAAHGTGAAKIKTRLKILQ